VTAGVAMIPAASAHLVRVMTSQVTLGLAGLAAQACVTTRPYFYSPLPTPYSLTRPYFYSPLPTPYSLTRPYFYSPLPTPPNPYYLLPTAHRAWCPMARVITRPPHRPSASQDHTRSTRPGGPQIRPPHSPGLGVG
jgi:hypothetical protein